MASPADKAYECRIIKKMFYDIASDDNFNETDENDKWKSRS